MAYAWKGIRKSSGRKLPYHGGSRIRSTRDVIVLVSLTFEWGKATVEDQLEIAELALGQDESSQRLCLCCKLVVTRRITGEQVLEDTSVGWVRHFL
jgi:hypothetical protein